VKKQYIKVFKKFNKLYEVYYDESGFKHYKEVKEPKLTLYKEDSKGEYRYLFDKDKRLSPINFNSLQEYNEYIEKAKYFDRLDRFYGHIRPEIQHIYSEYRDMKEFRKPIIGFFDIETGFNRSYLDRDNNVVLNGKKFPDILEADFPILSIVINIPQKNRKYVLGLKEYSGQFKDDYIKCSNEKMLLDKFITIVKNEVDVLSGWNTSMFDYPALFNRMKRLNIDIRRMSHFKFLDRKVIKGRDGEIKVDYKHPSDTVLIDFLELYKNMTFDNKDSYSLDFIANLELNVGKKEYDGDLMDLYNNQYEEFIDYNVQDVDLLVQLENKLKMHQTLFTMAYEMNCNFIDAFSTVVPWTAYIYKESMKNGIILPNDIKDSVEKMKFKGGFTYLEKPGHYSSLLSYDFSALYPSVQISFNISIEKILSDDKLNEELLELRYRYTDGENVEKFLNLNDDDYIHINSVLKKYNVVMTPNGQFFKKDEQGVVPELLETIIKTRKIYKNAMLKLEKIYEDYKNYSGKYGSNSYIISEDILLNGSEGDIVEKLLSMSNEYFRKNLEHIMSYAEFCNIFQLVKKVQANSQYGYSGNEYALLSNPEIAKSITSTGRFYVQWVKKNVDRYFDSKYGYKPFVYADTDSVLGSSKIYIKDGNKEMKMNIEDLFENINGYIIDKQIDNSMRVIKRDIYTLSYGDNIEYKRVKYIKKHRVKKRMFRIKYRDVEIVVTEDHSIIVERDDKTLSVKPNEIKKGDKIILCSA